MSNLTSAELNALLNAPEIPIPPGDVDNTVSPYATNFIPSIVLIIAVTTTVVAGRIFTRVRISRNTGVDDYFCVLAWAGLVAYIGITLKVHSLGLGLHVWELTLRQSIHLYHFSFYEEVVYGPVVFLAKLAILLLYLRMFVPMRTLSKPLYLAIHLTIWTNLAFYLMCTFIILFQCSPLERAWNPLIPGTCAINQQVTVAAAGVVNIVSDFIILALPFSSIWRLRMSWRDKAKVSTVFTFGLFACIAGVARLIYSIRFAQTLDSTYILAPLTFWTIAEISAGIICSCLPVLPRLFRHFIPKLISASRRSYAYGLGHIIQKRSVLHSRAPGFENDERWDDPYQLSRQPGNTDYNPLENPSLMNAEVVKQPDRVLLGRENGLSFRRTGSGDTEEGVPQDGIKEQVRIETHV